MGVRFPEKRKACVELVQAQRDTKSMVTFHEGESEIITPRGLPVALHRNRLMTGWGCLLMQGIHYGPSQHKLVEFKDDLLRNLAGNSFNAYCNGAVRIVKTTCLAHMCVRAKARKCRGPRCGKTYDIFMFDD